MASIEYVLFDFDGTLVDTAPDLVRTTNLFLADRGQRQLPEDVIRSKIGYGLKNLMLETFPGFLQGPAHLAQMERRFLEIYDNEFLKSPALFPGAAAFLSRWTEKIGILSNKKQHYIHAIVKHLGMEKLPWVRIIGGDTFPEMKPHPRPFLEAMKAAGVERQATVMVGDGHPDMEGATALGIRSVAVSFGYSPLPELVRLGASATIDSFDELPAVLNDFGKASL